MSGQERKSAREVTAMDALTSLSSGGNSVDDDDDEMRDESFTDDIEDGDDNEEEEYRPRNSGRRSSWSPTVVKELLRIRAEQVRPVVADHGADWSKNMPRGSWDKLWHKITPILQQEGCKHTIMKMCRFIKTLERSYPKVPVRKRSAHLKLFAEYLGFAMEAKNQPRAETHLAEENPYQGSLVAPILPNHPSMDEFATFITHFEAMQEEMRQLRETVSKLADRQQPQSPPPEIVTAHPIATASPSGNALEIRIPEKGLELVIKMNN
jgi:hypothetical protein